MSRYPILLIGGSGVIGRAAAQLLNASYPGTPLTPAPLS